MRVADDIEEEAVRRLFNQVCPSAVDGRRRLDALCMCVCLCDGACRGRRVEGLGLYALYVMEWLAGAIVDDACQWCVEKKFGHRHSASGLSLEGRKLKT